MTLVSIATINVVLRDLAEDLPHSFVSELLDEFIEFFVRPFFSDGLLWHENRETAALLEAHWHRCRFDLDTPRAVRNLHRRPRLQPSFCEQPPRDGDAPAGTNGRGHRQNHTSANNAITRAASSNNSPCPRPATISNRAFGIAAAIACECSGGNTSSSSPQSTSVGAVMLGSCARRSSVSNNDRIASAPAQNAGGSSAACFARCSM